jgi:hypothetical protein
MITIRVRSAMWFAAGLAVALVVTATFVGIRGYAAPGAGETTFVPIAPCRLFDYRPAPDTVGTRTTPLGPAETHTQQVTGTVGNCNIPTDATGVAMNVTITDPTAQSNLRIFPADVTAVPTASNLNWKPGQSPTPNKVDVKLSPSGALKLFNQNGTVYVLADATGYYTRIGLTDLQDQIVTMGNQLATTQTDLATTRTDLQAAQTQIDAARTQTVTYSGYEMNLIGSTDQTVSLINGCANAFSTNLGFLQIPLPTGATIIDVTAAVLDGPFTYGISLNRSVGDGTSDNLVNLVTAPLDVAGPAAIVELSLTPTNEVVDSGERFIVQFDDGAGGVAQSGDGLCSVTVTYQLPG